MTEGSPRKKGKTKVEILPPLYNFQGTKIEQLQQIYNQWYDCKRCLLHTFRRNPDGSPLPDIVFGDGNPDAKVMIVGEAPGEEEEATSYPFSGPSGRLLDMILGRVSDDTGIQELFEWYKKVRHTEVNQNHFHEKLREWRHQEFFITNTVSCRPPDNRIPTPHEVKACWERLVNIIYVVDPWLVIASGKTALEALTRKKNEITKKRGTIFEIELPGRVTHTYKIPVMATLHPSYLLRQADWNSKTGTYMQTLRDFMDAMRIVDNRKFRDLGIPIPHRIPLPRKES